MDPRKLVTLSFDQNVGPLDRIARALGGAVLAGSGWYFALPRWAATSMTVLGVMVLATAVLSKCSIYYLLGYSTCPVSGPPFVEKSR